MRMYNAGAVHFKYDVIAYSSTLSDARLKDNIVPIEGALAKVLALNGVEFDWNAGARKGQHDLGLIAQEVELVLPELIYENEMPLMDDAVEGEVYKTVDYDKIVGVLVEAIKELEARIKTLES